MTEKKIEVVPASSDEESEEKSRKSVIEVSLQVCGFVYFKSKNNFVIWVNFHGVIYW